MILYSMQLEIQHEKLEGKKSSTHTICKILLTPLKNASITKSNNFPHQIHELSASHSKLFVAHISLHK